MAWVVVYSFIEKYFVSGRARIGDLPRVEADVITTTLRKPYKVAKSQTRVLKIRIFFFDRKDRRNKSTNYSRQLKICRLLTMLNITDFQKQRYSYCRVTWVIIILTD